MKWMRTTAVFSAAMISAVLTPAATPPDHPQVIHTQRMPESKILRRVMPQYPQDAADAHIHGLVKISVMIGKDGHTKRVKLISGHPLLAPAALQAVRQWTYEPTEVNGYPVHVITEIDIPFDLDAHGLPIAPQAQLGSSARN